MRTDLAAWLAPVLLFIMLALPGCSLFVHQPPEADVPVQRRAPPFDSIDSYMSYLRQLTVSSDAEKKLLFKQVSHEYDNAPSLNAKLRMALALVLLEPPAGNLTRGRDLLNELLAPKGQLPPAQENLAIALLGAASRQQDTLQHGDTLETQLQEAQHKIKALTKIEQTIEQPAGPDK